MRLQSRWRLKPGEGGELGERVSPAWKKQGTVGMPCEAGITELKEAEVKKGWWAGSDKR